MFKDESCLQPKQSRRWLKSLNIIYLYPTRYYPIMLFVESRFQNETQFHAWSMVRPTFLSALHIPACSSFWYYCCILFFIFKLATCSKLGNREYLGESSVHYKSHQQEEAKERKGMGRGNTGHRLFHIISSSESNDRTKFGSSEFFSVSDVHTLTWEYTYVFIPTEIFPVLLFFDHFYV